MALFNNSWIYYRYDALSRLNERDVGLTLTEHWTYQAGSAAGTTTMRPETFYTTARGGSTKLIGFQYAYDNGGNITKVTNQVDSTRWDYAYDSQGQLTNAAEYLASGTVKNRYQYTYDTGGNLISWNEQNGSGTITASHTYTYGDSDWLDLLTAFDGEPITYDAIGNPLSYYNGSRYTMTWQNGRQLASVAVGGVTYNYEYDSSGIRTRKTNYDGSYTEYYVVEGLAVAEQRFYANGTPQYILRYLYDESNSPIGFGIIYPTASAPYWEYYYFGKNLQGDVVALYHSDYNGNNSYSPSLVATYTYDPWGAPTGIYNASGNPVSPSSYSAAALNPFRYRGYRYDWDTRLYYLESRYYDPAIGRFVNADAYASTGQGFLGHNMFAYCQNNPLSKVDPTGHYAEWVYRYFGTAYNYEKWIKYGLYWPTTKKTSHTKTSYTYRMTPNADSKNVNARIHLPSGDSINFSYTIYNRGVVSFNFDNNDYQSIINAGLEQEVANVIYDTVIIIDPSFAKGRTVDGIMTELSVHYFMSKHGILVSHANPADMGKPYFRSKPGYDSNAWLFEWIASLGQTPYVFP